MTPKEDPADRAARIKERRASNRDRRIETQEEAAGLTSDLRGVYGLRALSMFGQAKQ